MSDIKKLFEEFGKEQAIDIGQRFSMWDKNKVWFVMEGKVDIFFTKLKKGNEEGSLQNITRMQAGQIFFGSIIKFSKKEWGFLGRLSPDTLVYQMELETFKKLCLKKENQENIVQQINEWINILSEDIFKEIIPKDYKNIYPDKEIKIEENENLFSIEGVVWIQHQKGISYFLDNEMLPLKKTSLYFPLTRHTWTHVIENDLIKTFSTQSILTDEYFFDSLQWFHEIAFEYRLLYYRTEIKEEEIALKQRIVNDELSITNALQSLKEIFARKAFKIEKETRDLLFTVCSTIGEYLGITFKPPASLSTDIPTQEKLSDISRYSKIRIRKVLLEGDWWKQDVGPILAFTADTEDPIAIIPTNATSYALFNPFTKEKITVDKDVSDFLSPVAYIFYRSLGNEKIHLKGLLKFGMQHGFRDIMMIIIMGTCGGLFSLVTPLITGLLFDSVIPSAAKSQLFQLTLALLTSAFAIAAFELTRSFAMLRIEGKVDVSVQAALWDRLLRLPANFFRDYNAGDLAMRANSIDAIRQTLSGEFIQSLLSSIFAVFSFALLFYYSFTLALMAVGIAVVMMMFSLVMAWLKIKKERKIIELDGKISGIVAQFMAGISKIRATGSENRVFNYWTKEFSKMRQYVLTSQFYSTIQESVNSVFPIMSSVVIFGTIAFLIGSTKLSTGSFLAFIAAFTNFLTAALSLTGTLITVLAVIPMYERVKPLLETLPETNVEKLNPGELSGKFEISHVSFNYDKNGPVILKNVSLQVNPGEYVAIVGPSGSGKSTLLRLLLSFERPTDGTIYYDNHDLEDLDVDLVRQQIGVVLQNGQLFPGDIFTNIIGSSTLTLEDAWEAARNCGLDKDIEEMPMGMFTLVSEGGGGLSGGQKQRLMIARAIVHKPRILFFDEATSALDNVTQSIVSKSLEKLKVTRVVIAHRLSTIINADCIFVIKEGEMIESGNYDALIKKGGVFADLAKRQIA